MATLVELNRDKLNTQGQINSLAIRLSSLKAYLPAYSKQPILLFEKSNVQRRAPFGWNTVATAKINKFPGLNMLDVYYSSSWERGPEAIIQIRITIDGVSTVSIPPTWTEQHFRLDISKLSEGVHTLNLQWTARMKYGEDLCLANIKYYKIYTIPSSVKASMNAEIRSLEAKLASLRRSLAQIETQITEKIVEESLRGKVEIIRKETDQKMVAVQKQAAATIEAVREDYMIRDENVRAEAAAKVEAARIEAEEKVELARIEADTKIALAREESDKKIQAVRLEKAEQFAEAINQINAAFGAKDKIFNVETILPATSDELLKITTSTSEKIKAALDEADKKAILAQQNADKRVSVAMADADRSIADYKKKTDVEVKRIEEAANATIARISAEADREFESLKRAEMVKAGILPAIDLEKLLPLALMGGFLVVRGVEKKEGQLKIK